MTATSPPPDTEDGRPPGHQGQASRPPEVAPASAVNPLAKVTRTYALPAYDISDLDAATAQRITIHPLTNCWLVGGYHDADGYARIGGRGAHRVIWERLIGAVPDGLVLDHREDQGCVLNDGMPDKACAYPGHLRPVTNFENSTRNGVHGVAAVNIRKDRCGVCNEPYDLLNTYWHGNRRDCRRCIARRVHEYRERNPEAVRATRRRRRERQRLAALNVTASNDATTAGRYGRAA